MCRFYSSFLVFYFVFFLASAQDNQTLITIGDTRISRDEFERIYRKNNTNLLNENDKKTPSAYLDLFIRFKLKVLDAETEKLDTSSAFINELAGYRKELAAPYLTDVQFEESLVSELYERMKKEVNASHILLLVEQNASPEREKAVLDKITRLREMILSGKDFHKIAREYSEDPSAKMNQGNLGFFTAFQMVTPFENAAYNTPVGQISQPVRTTFGYHLIRVNDIRENQGEIKVAHIMKMFTHNHQTDNSHDHDGEKEHLRAEMDSIYKALLAGAGFSEMARLYSDDKRTAEQGGELAWFSSGSMVPQFSDPAFALKKIGDFTPPVETPYGFHIIKKLDVRPVKSFEEVKEEIISRIKRDPERINTGKKAFADKLKAEYGYRENAQNTGRLKDIMTGTSPVPGDQVLFTVKNRSYSLKQMADYIGENKISGGTYADHYQTWVAHVLVNLEDSLLEEKYPDFRHLMQEYHDGILLFNISSEKIWNRASADTAGLLAYYDKYRGKYLWEERFKGYIVICNSTEIKEKAEEYFSSGMTGEEILDMMNSEEKKLTITEGAWEKGDQPIVDYYVWNGPEPPYFVPEHTFIRGDKIPPEPKLLDEARGHYISDYQNYLEEEWVKDLRKKYKVKINRKLLKTIPGV